MSQLIKCTCCDKMIPVSNAELTFMRPDVIAALSSEEREARCTQEWEDGYTFDEERFFVRALIPFPVDSAEDDYCLGAWVEINKADYLSIVEDWDNDIASPSKVVNGTLANQIPYSKNSVDCSVKLVATDNNSRPILTILDESCSLFAEQKNGISRHRSAEFTNVYRNQQRWKVIEEDEFEPGECSCCKGKIRLMAGCIENEFEEVEADYWLRIPEGHKGIYTIAVSLDNGGHRRVAVMRGESGKDGLTYWIQSKDQSPWENFGKYGDVMDIDEVLGDIYKSLFFDVVDKVAADDPRLQSQIR